MLVFGENGSGKSSVLVALREFFNRVAGPPTFDNFRNVFTRDPVGQPLTSGRVCMEFDDSSGLHTWDIVRDVRPISAPAVAEAALRFGSVDYRDMLKTSFVHATGYPNLFGLLVNGVLARMPVTVAGRQTTLGDVAEDMRQAKPCGHYARVLRKADAACLALNTALVNHIPPLAAAANQILSAFGNIGVTFQLIPPPLPQITLMDRMGMRIAASGKASSRSQGRRGRTRQRFIYEHEYFRPRAAPRRTSPLYVARWAQRYHYRENPLGYQY